MKYSLLLRKHLIPRFGGHRLCDISRVEVQQYLLEKLRQGFAWETTNHLRHLLSKVMGTAVNWEYIQNNPVRGVKMPERTLKRPHKFLTAEEVRQLVSISKEPTRTVILLAVMTGLRIGEILAFRWGRVDLLEERYSWPRPATKGTSVHRRRGRAGVKFRWLHPLCVNSKRTTRAQEITLPVPWFLRLTKVLRFLRTISERSRYVPHASVLGFHGSIGIRFVTRTARCCTPKERR
jgi:integrase